jgi:hypothetical protein
MNNAVITPEFSLVDLIKSKGLSLQEVGLYIMFWGISDESLIFYNITDLAQLGNCGIDKVKGLIDKLIEKKLLIKFRINKKTCFYKILCPGENYENAKKEFSKC